MKVPSESDNEMEIDSYQTNAPVNIDELWGLGNTVEVSFSDMDSMPDLMSVSDSEDSVVFLLTPLDNSTATHSDISDGMDLKDVWRRWGNGASRRWGWGQSNSIRCCHAWLNWCCLCTHPQSHMQSPPRLHPHLLHCLQPLSLPCWLLSLTWALDLVLPCLFPLPSSLCFNFPFYDSYNIHSMSLSVLFPVFPPQPLLPPA